MVTKPTRKPPVTLQDFTVALFCRVDDALSLERKHPLAALHPSEVVTLGMLHALRAGGGRAFYRWVEREMKTLFPRLPERTRLFRLFEQHASQTQRFLAEPTLFGVCDSFGIELIHPRREGRSPHADRAQNQKQPQMDRGREVGLGMQLEGANRALALHSGFVS